MRQQYGLSPQMSKLLDFIQAYQQDNGYCPSFEDMMNHLRLRSKSGVFRLVQELEDRGHVIRLPGQSRSVRAVADNTVTIQFPTELEETLRIRADILGLPIESLIVKFCRDGLTGQKLKWYESVK